MKYLPPRERAPAVALGLGAELLNRAANARESWLAASVVRGPFVALGAHQRAGRVLDLGACERAGVAVYRRATSGTAFHAAGESVVFSLALPHVAALAPDATPRTLLNRNVRGFLQGLTRCGAPAHYFGREWISVRHRPGALLGYECTPGGAVLIDVLAGYDAPFALPAALTTPAERAVDRWQGREPVSLREAFGAVRDASGVAARVCEGVAARYSVALETADEPEAVAPAGRVREADDPAPAGAQWLPGRPCPIGWIDAAHVPGPPGAWLGGDVLAPRFALDLISRAGGEVAVDFALDGVTVDELRAALVG